MLLLGNKILGNLDIAGCRSKRPRAICVASAKTIARRSARRHAHSRPVVGWESRRIRDDQGSSCAAKERLGGYRCCRCDTTGNTLLSFRNQARCRAPRTKIFLFPIIVNCVLCHASRAHKRGGSRSSRTSSAGCDGRGRVARRAARRVRSSRVVLSPRRWGQPPGHEPGGTVAKKPASPGRARSSR